MREYINMEVPIDSKEDNIDELANVTISRDSSFDREDPWGKLYAWNTLFT